MVPIAQQYRIQNISCFHEQFASTAINEEKLTKTLFHLLNRITKVLWEYFILSRQEDDNLTAIALQI